MIRVSSLMFYLLQSLWALMIGVIRSVRDPSFNTTLISTLIASGRIIRSVSTLSLPNLNIGDRRMGTGEWGQGNEDRKMRTGNRRQRTGE